MSSKLKQAKQIAKNNPQFNPYKGVYSLLPDVSNTTPIDKQQYINGHYCYTFKAGIVTNGLGVIRHIALLDEPFKKLHPEIVVPKSDNPDLDKEISDSASLNPVLSDFFNLHQNFTYSIF